MTKLLQIYKCNVCGNVVEVLNTGRGDLVCCQQTMELKNENTQDAAKEKHIPVVEIAGNKVTVKVGSVAHPMEVKHSIEWIEVLADGKSYLQFLNPGDAPEAVFEITADNIVARAYCNLHGLWKA